MVTGGGERVTEPDGDSAGHVCPDNIWWVWVLIDDGIGCEQCGDAVGIVAVEAFAVGVDQLGDRLAVDKLRSMSAPVLVRGLFQSLFEASSAPRIGELRVTHSLIIVNPIALRTSMR